MLVLSSINSLREIGNSLPNNRRQRRTCYAMCHILYPVSAAHTSIFRMDSNFTSYRKFSQVVFVPCVRETQILVEQQLPLSV